MSFEPDNTDHNERETEGTDDIIRWLKVIAHILGDMQDLDKDEIYEDMD